MKILPYNPIARRDFIKTCLGLGALSVVAPEELFAQIEGVNLGANYRIVPVGTRQRPVVIFWLEGGMSHINTFNTIPGAQVEYRGPFNSIQTSVPGLRISEHLPLMANQMHRVALLKNIYHTQGDHRLATNRMFTGSDNERSGSPEYMPFTVRLKRHLDSDNVASYIVIKSDGFYTPWAALGAGEALTVEKNTNTATVGNIPYRSPFGEGFDVSRHDGRVGLLNQLNSSGRVQGPPAERWDGLFDRASSALRGRLNGAFDLSRVPPAERERYGNTELGNSALVAKRLVEAGAPFITINNYLWDHHGNIGSALTARDRLPALDKALSSVIQDLGNRAIVVVASEFGRTPRVNSSAGRDHWPQSNFMIISGIGQKVIGELDNTGQIIGRDGRLNAALMGPTILRAAGYEIVEERSGVLTTNKIPYYPIFD